jgi:polysaccharide deacetylase family protein (PEP-CTERM system associated)
MNRASVMNAMTVDVEDYFQVSAFDRVVSRSAWEGMESRVVGNTRRLLDLFDEHHVTGTFFVLGWVADRHPSLVRDIAGRGHEIASHGYGHRLVYELTPGEFRGDIRRAKQVLESASGQSVTGYRAPSYSITRRSLWALDILVEEGYTFDSSIFPIHHDRYGIPGTPRHPHTLRLASGPLVEVPPSTVKVGTMTLPVAGGGYFRLLPYGWTRWGIERLNAHEGRPAVFFLHPWEIDAAQPRLPVTGLSRFRHYRNLDQTETRLRQLLTAFHFGPIRTLLSTTPAQSDWLVTALQRAG